MAGVVARLGRGGLLGRPHGIEEAEKLVDMRNFQRGMYTLVHAHQGETSSAMLPRDIGANQSSDTPRIHIRDVREIDDERARSIGPHGGLETEHVGHDQWAAQA